MKNVTPGAHLDARRAIPAEGLQRRDHGPLGVAARHRREPRGAADAGGDVLAAPLDERRLGVEEIDVRRAAALPEHHDPPGPGRVVRQAGKPAVGRGRPAGVAAEQRRQGHGARAERGGAEEAAPVQ